MNERAVVSQPLTDAASAAPRQGETIGETHGACKPNLGSELHAIGGLVVEVIEVP